MLVVEEAVEIRKSTMKILSNRKSRGTFARANLSGTSMNWR